MVAIVTGAGLGLERSSGFVLGSNGQLGTSTFGQDGENVTVNAATGNLFIDRTDEILIGQGPDSALTRSYNSLGLSTDDNGDNWQLSAQKSVSGLTGTVNRTGSTITRTDWDGSQTVYTYSSSAGAYVSQQSGGAYDTLTFASNKWTWTDGSTRMVETYDATNGGRIISARDSSGNTITYGYTGTLLTRITTQDGEHTDLTWSGNNLTQISTTLANGSVSTSTRYTYDSSNRLSTVTTDLTPGDNSVADGNAVTTTYTYDGTSDRVASISQTGGASLVIGYTLVGSTYRVSSLTQTLAAGVTSTTSLSYNTGTNTTTVTDAQNQVTQLVYDSNDQLVQMTLPQAQAGAAAQVTSYTYDSHGNVLTAKDALGNVTTYQYDSRGNLTLMRDAMGNTVTRSYSSDNQMLTQTTYAVPDPDGAGTGKPSQPSTTRYIYDSKDRLSFVIDPLGYITEYDYNSVGQQTTTIVYRDDPADLSGMSPTDTFSYTNMVNGASEDADKSTVERTDTTYDFRGNVSTVTTYSAAATNGAGLTSQPYTVVTYVYDQHGNLLSRQTSGVANSQVYSYDGLGRIVGSTDLNGGTTSVAFTAGTNTSVVTLASGLVTTSLYNLAGELISSTQSGSGITSATTSYAYNNLGELRMVTDALGNKTYYLYDAVGRKVADIAADGSITEYRYNADDQVVATIDYATQLSAAALASLVDSNGNPANVSLSSILPAASGSDVWNWNIYDKAGRLIENVNGDGDVTTFSYDGMSNKTATTSYANVLSAATLSGFKTTAPTSLQLPTASSGHDATTRYFYDEDNQLIGTLNADGYLSEIGYDGAGEVIKTVTYATAARASLRASGSLSALESNVDGAANDLYADYIYDGEGRLEYALNNQVYPTQYVYDAAGNLVQTIVYGAPIATPAEYDTNHFISGIQALARTNPPTRVNWSVYDAAGRVAYSIDANGDVVGYSYDSMGNVIKQVAYATQRSTTSAPSLATMNSWAASSSSSSDRVSRMIYNRAGELVYEVDPQGYVTEHRYDRDGNPVLDIRYADVYTVGDGATPASMASLIGSIPSTAVQTSYGYDADGRLVDSYDGMGIRTHLVYNALGQVTDKTVAYGLPDAATCHYTYDTAGRLLGTTEAYGTPAAATTSNTYDGLGHVFTTVDARGFTTSYTYDAMGQVLTATTPIDGTNSAVTTNQYDAFGNVIKTTDALGNSTFFYYDTLDRLVLEVDANGYATKTSYGLGNEVASITHYATKITGTLTTGTMPTVTTSSADEVTGFTRDKLGRVIQETDAQGYYEQYTLDAFGDQIAVRNKLGGVTTNTFDHRGLLISETLPENSVRADGTVEATSVTNTYSYDARGNRTQMVEAFGLSEARTTNYAYDKDDRLIRTTGDAVSVVAADLQTTSTVTPTTTFVYDDHGNVIESDDAMGARTLSYYDTLGRKTAQVNATGVLSTWNYDANGNVTSQRVYDTAITLPAAPGGAAPSQASGSYRETDYTYDRANQLLTTTVNGVLTGQYGSSYATATVNATIRNVYDKDGNLISQTDADGNTVFYYYDKMGQKIAQVDQSNYLTTYTLNADGNVLTETEYATALSAVPTTTSNPATLASSVTGNANDRITTFTYDKNGRRLTENRLNVAAWNVSTTTGALTAASTTSIVTYTYNGLGEVTSQTQATGDHTDYAYDAAGRQTSVTESAYTDYTGASVSNTSVESYDGLNNLTRTVANGTRITTSTYGAGGLLSSMTDADGFTTNYQYDADGRVVKQGYMRVQADGTSVTEAKATRYDVLGRAVFQSVATWNGSNWVFGDETQTQYNAYGEVVASGVNGLTQETSSYDNAGRVWRTTSGDGTAKLYLYDANGNQTLEITSDGNALPSGYSWATITQSQAIALLTNNGASAIGTVAVPGMVVTITAYDKRGQVLQTLQPLRQLSGTTTATATIIQSHLYNAFGEVTQDTDANGNATNYVYNTLGKIVQQIDPIVNSTAENGAVTSIRPTQTNYYDLSGRLVGTKDANGNTNTRVLLSGTGYGGSDVSVVKEFHADSGTVTNGYDVFGDLRRTTNEDGNVESFTYDAMDRLVTDTHPTVKANTPGNNTGSDITLIDYYAYDGLGQRIQHWNSEYGASAKEQTFYDAQGRIVRTTDMAGHATSYSYTWSSSIATSGLGTFGGWTKTTTNPAGLTSTQNIDYFGRTVSKTDFGGHIYAYTFDQAGRTIALTNSIGENQAYTYYNTGNLEFIDNYSAGASVSVPGNTWINGTNGTPPVTDSFGHVIEPGTPGTPGYYENITTATTETDSQGVFVPGDTGWTDTSGVVHDATSGHYATTVTDTTTETIVIATQTTETLSQRTAYEYDAVGNRTHESYINGPLGNVPVQTFVTTNVNTQTLVTTAVTTDSVTTTTVSGTEVDTVNSTHLTVDPSAVAGDTWVPPVTDSHGNIVTAGYYEQQVTGYNAVSVTDYAEVDTTGDTWVPPVTDSHGNIVTAGYYEKLVSTTTSQSVTDYAQVDTTGDTWVPPVTDSHGNIVTAGYYEKPVTVYTPESVTDYAEVDTTGDTWVPANGGTPGYYEKQVTTTTPESVTDYAEVDTTGDTWVPPVTDSHGNVITAGYYEQQVTTYTPESVTDYAEVDTTGDTWVPPVTDSHGNVITAGYYEKQVTTTTPESVTDYAEVNTTGDTWVPANGATPGYYEKPVTVYTPESVTDYAEVDTTGDTWVPANGSTPGYYEKQVTTTTPESVTDYAEVDTTGDTWVPPVTDSHGNVITAGYYEKQVTTYTPESVTDYAEVNTTGDTWVPPVTDSHGNVITAGYYEKQVTTTTPESVTDYAEVDTTGDTWVPANGSTPGYYEKQVTTYTPESVTDYAEVDTTGDTWVPGTPAQTDSFGHVIVAATPGYYEKQVTTYTAEIWVPPVTDSFGHVVGGGFYVPAPPGTPANQIVEVPTTTWQVVQPTTHTVQVPSTSWQVVQPTTHTVEVTTTNWQEVAPTTHTIQVPSTSWQVVQPTTHTIEVTSTTWQEVAPTTHTIQVPSTQWQVVAPTTHTVDVTSTIWQEVAPTTHTIQVPSTQWQVVAPTTHTVQVTTTNWQEVAPTTHTVQVPSTSWQVVAPTTHTVQVTTQSWQEVAPTTHTVEEPYTTMVTVDPSTYMVETPYTYTVSTPWSYTEHGAAPSTTTTTGAPTDTFSSSSTVSTTTYTGPSGPSYEDETITYDAMNRMSSVSDTGYNNAAPITIALQYDANGNIRERDTTYYALNADGSEASVSSTEDDWYKYDAMNRFVTTKGTLEGARGSGSIVRGASGTDLSYDLAGNRVSASSTEHYSGSSYTDSFGNVHTVSAGGYQEQTELYTYTADGALAQVNLAYGAMSSDPNAIPHSTGAGTELASYVYDAMGRTTLYTEYQTGTSTAVYTRTAAYDADSNVTMDSVTTVRSDGTYIANTTYDYRLQTSDGAYDGAYMGVLTHSRTTNTGKAAPTSDTVNQYGWFDGAVISSTSLTPDVTQGGTNISTYAYDAAGHVIEVRIQDGQPRTIDLVNNAQGEVIKRDVVYDSGIAAPHELHYYVGGMAIGDVTNDGGGTSSTDYVTSIAEQMATPGNGAFQGGSEIANSYADFDQSYDPINGFDAASTQQSYTVAQGDSLQNIAQQLWGDASLWYLIADANGLSSSSVLTAGMMLTIPDKVTNFHNTSSTYQVYDPNAAIGDTSPNKQAPPQPAPVQPVGKHGGGCGVFGEIIEVVVAAVAAYFTFGAALGALGAASAATASLGELALAGAAAGAVGSVAAQGFGLATGMQKSFNWGGVAEGAIGGALGGALAGVSGLSGSGFLPSVERGIIGNVATQGIEVATGLEKSFDWAGVAASAVGSAAGWEVGSLIGYTPGAPVTNINNDLLGGVAGTAGAIASAATRSLINGSDFGGNIISALPGTIGQTIGNLVAGAIEGPPIERVTVTPQAAQIAGTAGSNGGGGPITQDQVARAVANQYPDMRNIQVVGSAGVINTGAVTPDSQSIWKIMAQPVTVDANPFGPGKVAEAIPFSSLVPDYVVSNDQVSLSTALGAGDDNNVYWILTDMNTGAISTPISTATAGGVAVPQIGGGVIFSDQSADTFSQIVQQGLAGFLSAGASTYHAVAGIISDPVGSAETAANFVNQISTPLGAASFLYHSATTAVSAGQQLASGAQAAYHNGALPGFVANKVGAVAFGLTTLPIGGGEVEGGALVGDAAEGAVGESTTVYRVWGGEAEPYGRSWTTVDPRTIPNYRDIAGLPNGNSGRFLSEGILQNAEGVTTRGALPLDGNAGGLSEVIIPDPKAQVQLKVIQGLNPEF